MYHSTHWGLLRKLGGMVSLRISRVFMCPEKMLRLEASAI